MSQGRKVSKADCLKRLDEICEPDPRNLSYQILDKNLGKYRPFTFEDYYRDVEAFKLHDGVPKDVFIQFEKARNLYLYTWFVYRFGQVAELQAYAATEFALRIRHGGNTRKRLKALLNYAVKNGWIKDEGFRGYQQRMLRRKRDLEMLRAIDPDLAERADKQKKDGYVKVLAETMPRLRNTLAHGGPTLYPNIFTTLEICSDIINQLFGNNPGS